MFKHYFERISEQVAIYPLVSLTIFFLFFLGMGIWVATVKKTYIDHMSALPLEDDTKKN
jgi:cytochrome c oxidase cbb3-type subunit 3